MLVGGEIRKSCLQGASGWVGQMHVSSGVLNRKLIRFGILNDNPGFVHALLSTDSSRRSAPLTTKPWSTRSSRQSVSEAL